MIFSRNNHQAVLLDVPHRMQIRWDWVIKGLLASIVIAVLGFVWIWLSDPQSLPLRKIRVLGTFEHVNEQMLHQAVATSLDDGYVGVDINMTQKQLESIPWVMHASVRRVWPDTLAITVQEQVALARWEKGGLINPNGKLFKPAVQDYPKNLPVFVAPEGMQERLTKFYYTAQSLMSGLDLHIVKIEMDARQAVSLTLDNQMQLIVGRENFSERLQRFASIYKSTIAARVEDIARVDLRYTNGLAIGWRKQPMSQVRS